MQQLLRDQIPFPMVQVWRNSQEEIARFKKMENAVLFAAGSCWEGVDFPGDMVSSLIIVKLPFSVPDPIHEAQKEQYRSLESYIQTIVVPDMQKKLRQGFGRAIRIEERQVPGRCSGRPSEVPDGRADRRSRRFYPKPESGALLQLRASVALLVLPRSG